MYIYSIESLHNKNAVINYKTIHFCCNGKLIFGLKAFREKRNCFLVEIRFTNTRL